VLLIDEIDAHLHPYLINKFLKFLTSQKNSNIQVIFTTHDISILYEKSLAKDQI
jgi:AAA15 family ATPase/GTPase